MRTRITSRPSSSVGSSGSALELKFVFSVAEDVDVATMAAKGGRRASQDKTGAPVDEFNFDYDMPVIINVKPEDQLDIAPEELEKEVLFFNTECRNDFSAEDLFCRDGTIVLICRRDTQKLQQPTTRPVLLSWNFCFCRSMSWKNAYAGSAEENRYVPFMCCSSNYLQ